MTDPARGEGHDDATHPRAPRAGRHRSAGRAPRRPWVTVVVSVLLLGLAVGGLATGLSRARPASRPADRVTSPVAGPPTRSTGPAEVVAHPTTGTTEGAAAPRSAPSARPTRVRIPAIGVDSALQPLGLLPDGSLQSPSQWQEAGWFARGVVPGQVGPAVVVGHVDSTAGPAVFFRLRQLTPGDRVDITRTDGSVLVFVVDGAQQLAKSTFPTATVYGPTPDPELRLVTCTGPFDVQARSYVDNLVVSAHLLT